MLGYDSSTTTVTKRRIEEQCESVETVASLGSER